jgi:hypothetical protein
VLRSSLPVELWYFGQREISPAMAAAVEPLDVRAKGARATRSQRKKAIVAVARQLAVDLWRLHTGRCTPAVLGFK